MFDIEKIRARITAIAITENNLSTDQAHDVAFHMTDWLDDLSALVDFYKNPDVGSAEQIDSMLYDVLIHAPDHLAAAAKIYADAPVRDIFGVGAVEVAAP